MQELMSRHKAYSLSPRDCLKTTLFQKWQRMVAPPGKRGTFLLHKTNGDIISLPHPLKNIPPSIKNDPLCRRFVFMFFHISILEIENFTFLFVDFNLQNFFYHIFDFIFFSFFCSSSNPTKTQTNTNTMLCTDVLCVDCA